MTSRIVGFARSAAVRWAFLVVALTATVVSLVTSREEVAAALTQMTAPALVGAAVASLLYLPITMLAWRAVMTDLGTSTSWTAALSIFGPSQLGKYLPGGIWTVVAAGELGADLAIPRRRSVSAMGVALLVAVVSGVPVAVLAVVLGPEGVADRFGWVVGLVPVAVVALAPPVLNRLLTWCLRLVGRPPLEQPVTLRGIAVASAWSVFGWLVAGAQVWLLARPLGVEPGDPSFGLCVMAYALAWVVGFVVVIVPAGLGAREAVLVLLLGPALVPGGVLTVVILSRVLFTLVDIVFGLGGLALSRRARAAARPG